MKPEEVDAKLAEMTPDPRLPGGTIDTEFIPDLGAGGAEGQHSTIDGAFLANNSIISSEEALTAAEATRRLGHFPQWLQEVISSRSQDKKTPGYSSSMHNYHLHARVHECCMNYSNPQSRR